MASGPKRLSYSDENLETTIFRMCHFCDHINQSHFPMPRCHKCGKPIVLFVETIDFKEEAKNEEFDTEYAPWFEVYDRLQGIDPEDPLSTKQSDYTESDPKNVWDNSEDDEEVPGLRGLSVLWK